MDNTTKLGFVSKPAPKREPNLYLKPARTHKIRAFCRSIDWNNLFGLLRDWAIVIGIILYFVL